MTATKNKYRERGLDKFLEVFVNQATKLTNARLQTLPGEPKKKEKKEWLEYRARDKQEGGIQEQQLADDGFGKPEPVLNASKYGQFVSKKAMLASKKTIVPCVYPQSEPCN